VSGCHCTLAAPCVPLAPHLCHQFSCTLLPGLQHLPQVCLLCLHGCHLRPCCCSCLLCCCQGGLHTLLCSSPGCLVRLQGGTRTLSSISDDQGKGLDR
jgi:hypothetical protein